MYIHDILQQKFDFWRFAPKISKFLRLSLGKLQAFEIFDKLDWYPPRVAHIWEILQLDGKSCRKLPWCPK